MKRVEIFYDGKPYFVTGRTAEVVATELRDALSSGEPSWFTAKTGEGRIEDARLLIGPGISIVVVQVEPTAVVEEPDEGETFNVDLL